MLNKKPCFDALIVTPDDYQERSVIKHATVCRKCMQLPEYRRLTEVFVFWYTINMTDHGTE